MVLTIDSIDANYKKIETIQGETIKYITYGKDKDFMKGTFCMMGQDKIYINYIKPLKTILLSDSILWIYLPDEKKAIKVDYGNLSQMERSLLGLQSFFGIDPLGEFKDKFSFKIEKDTLIGIPTNGIFISKITAKIDTEKMCIEELDIFDKKGKLYSKTVYSDFKNYKDIWIPQSIITELFTTGIKEETFFKNLSVNEEVDSLYFNFIPNEGIDIIESR